MGRLARRDEEGPLGIQPPAPRFFAALDPREAPAPRRASASLAAPFFVGALIVVAAVRSVLLRVLLPLALTAAAIAMMFRRKPAPKKEPRPRRGLTVDTQRVVFHPENGEPTTLVSLEMTFGVTLVASAKRDRVVVALSSTIGAFYVGARLDGTDASASLVERASTLALDEAGLDAIGPDGEPLVLSAAELAQLVETLIQASPACVDRFVLTDARGAPLLLDGRELTVGDRSVDLNAPLEWRSIVFQEPFGAAVAVYQGTWVRQAGTELVLVSLLPSLASAGSDLDPSRLDRAALRDLRLMQASPEEPPPRDQRVAIDRLFMLPLRTALDRAPRPSQKPFAAHT